MDRLEQQISTLSHKIDGIHQILEKLTLQVAKCQEMASQAPLSEPMTSISNYKQYAQSSWISKLEMNHKDILIDENDQYSNINSEQSLSPETQVRRLTAQLTAAYNRIAALEEQILSKRVNSL